jgi:hypothetical protein
MAYSPLFEFLFTIVTILIILFSIGVLLYIEKHHQYGIEDMATPVIVDQTEKTAVLVKRISRTDVK